MAELIGCPYVLVPEAGHISNLENPGFVTEALLQFLTERTRVDRVIVLREQARSHSRCTVNLWERACSRRRR